MPATLRAALLRSAALAIVVTSVLSCESQSFGPRSPSSIGPLAASSLDSIASSLAWRAAYDSAAHYYELSAARHLADDNWVGYVRALTNVGANQRDAGQYEIGLRTIQVADSIAKKKGVLDESTVASVLLARGITLIRLSQLREAEATIRKAILVANASPRALDLARAHQAMGWVLQEANDHQEAFDSFRRALRLAPDDDMGQLLRARTWNSLGISFYALEIPDSSLVYYGMAVDARLRILGSKHPLYAASLANLALAHHLNGDRRTAVKLYTDATKTYIIRLGKDHPEIARCFTNLGQLYMDAGLLNLAQVVLDRALEMRRISLGDDHVSLMYTHRALAELAFIKGDYDLVAKHGSSVLTLAATYSNAPYNPVVESTLLMGQAFEASGNHSLAQEYFRRAKIQIRASPSVNQRSASAIDYFIARSYLHVNNPNKARQILGSHCDRLGTFRTYFRVSQTDCFLLRATISLSLGDLRDAADLVDLSIQIVRTGRGIDRKDKFRQLVDAFLIRAEIAVARYRQDSSLHELEKAQRWSRTAQSAALRLQRFVVGDDSKRVVAQQTAAAGNINIWSRLELLRLTSDHSHVDEALIASEGRLTGTFIFGNRDSSIDVSIPERLIERERSLLSSLRAMADRGIAPNQDDYIRMISTIAEYEYVVDVIEDISPEFFGQAFGTTRETLDKIKSTLQPQELAIEFAHGDSVVVAFLLSTNGAEIGYTVSSNRVDSVSANLRHAIESRSYDKFVAAARSAYRLLVEPIEDKIQGKQLIIIPDGPLHFVPFELLLTADVAQETDERAYRTIPYLIRKNPISYSYSASLMADLRNRQRPQAPMDFLGIAPGFAQDRTIQDEIAPAPSGAVKYVGSDSIVSQLRRIHLPGTLQEVRDIRRLFDSDRPAWKRITDPRTKTLVRAAATESKLGAINLSKYRIIHLATHAFADESVPERSALILSEDASPATDGLLQLSEVYNLQTNADLVVLSACETGLGRLAKGEGMIGLTRGFLYSGASSVVVSLWQADDWITRELMTQFYTELVAGKPKSIALRDAKLFTIAKSPVHALPYHWAHFVLIGE